MTTVKRSYAPRMPAEQRREQLLDAALKIINTQGVAAVSVDAVAKACDVTRPVVYGQFTDANHILRASLQRESSRALEQLASVLTLPPDGVFAAQWFADLTRSVLETMQAHPATWRAILLPVGEVPPPLRKVRTQGEHLVQAQLTDIIGHFLRDRGNATDMDIELLAKMIIRMVEEAGRLVLESPEDYPPERIASFARVMAEAILNQNR